MDAEITSMQIIHMIGMDAAEYAKKEMHRQVNRPPQCRQCRSNGSLRALGFYSRSSTASTTGSIVVIKVRRFVCQACRKTTSLLPSFAQPYRLICSVTIQRHFESAPATLDTYRWRFLLRRYFKKFRAWLPELAAQLGHIFGLPPPTAHNDPWKLLTKTWPGAGLGATTHQMVDQFQITIFGKYRCHG